MKRQETENNAAYWLAKLDKDNLIDFNDIDLAFLAARNNDFKAWVEDSDYNRVAFLQLVYVWQHDALAHAYESRVVKVTKKRSIFIAMAATVMLLIMPMMQFLSHSNKDVYETNIGKRQSVLLVDGSKVELNSESKITASITDEERVVTLVKGEAFFDIAHLNGKPFRVFTGEQIITVIGTKFSVHKVGDDIKVVVSEGKVQVDHLKQTASSEMAVLVAGNIAQTKDDEIVVIKDTKEAVEQKLSWRTGLITFDGTTLEDAIAEFNRYNKVKLIFKGSDISQLKVSGQFKSQNYDAFLRLISEGYGLKISYSDSNKVIEISS
ncbi:FecR family protein [Pseudocolwellia agarivorans]|uniref:FecR family protein n=1 Tax=Pseudocolwellia agarivorans TaxID=1911682 RepID=UPI000985B277|nr:FecR domain-containing protein [Pseudocolwellia agarivorans]